jgi:hypothetical protein
MRYWNLGLVQAYFYASFCLGELDEVTSFACPFTCASCFRVMHMHVQIVCDQKCQAWCAELRLFYANFLLSTKNANTLWT